ncbi:MAG: hypothetical protein O2931_06715, partial [Planctomycetota bacterium]|nr:hypothetical protein [Planctomycetota bacterium]
ICPEGWMEGEAGEIGRSGDPKSGVDLVVARAEVRDECGRLLASVRRGVSRRFGHAIAMTNVGRDDGQLIR